MLVVVTSGGVKEKIDNVRSITNSSSGKLGKKIVNEFLNQNSKCVIKYIYGGTAESIENERVENIKIKNTADLLSCVIKILTENKVDIFVHSMAVADYTTSFVIDFVRLKTKLLNREDLDNPDKLIQDCIIENNSKISSSLEAPAIVLEKTPKVIEQIKKLSPYTFLVGFKLLDSVPKEELFDVGFDLLRKNRCNLVLGNDISEIRSGKHSGMLIYPEKTFDMVEGKDDIARYLVQKSLERYNVKHPKSLQNSLDNKISDDLYNEFYTTGKWLNQKDFLPKVINHERVDKIGTYGNMSCRRSDCFYITCRNVNKSDLKKEDISRITRVNLITDDKSVYSKIYYNSELKPSIDTTIHSLIYKNSSYSYAIHIHTNRVFLGYPLVEESYPCGCDLECFSIVKLIKKNPNVDIIQMKKHGLIILGYSFEECCEKIENLFKEIPYIDYDNHTISQECIDHIKEVNPICVTSDKVYVLGLNNQDIGCLYEEIENNLVHFGLFTMSNIRGKGLHIVEKYLRLYSKNYILHTTKGCNIADFYKKKYGFLNYDLTNESDLQFLKERE